MKQKFHNSIQHSQLLLCWCLTCTPPTYTCQRLQQLYYTIIHIFATRKRKANSISLWWHKIKTRKEEIKASVSCDNSCGKSSVNMSRKENLVRGWWRKKKQTGIRDMGHRKYSRSASLKGISSLFLKHEIGFSRKLVFCEADELEPKARQAMMDRQGFELHSVNCLMRNQTFIIFDKTSMIR